MWPRWHICFQYEVKNILRRRKINHVLPSCKFGILNYWFGTDFGILNYGSLFQRWLYKAALVKCFSFKIIWSHCLARILSRTKYWPFLSKRAGPFLAYKLAGPKPHHLLCPPPPSQLIVRRIKYYHQGQYRRL